MNTYVKIQYPNIYYFNLDLLGICFKKMGGNALYYISEYRSKILKLSNQGMRFEKKLHICKDLKSLLENINIFLKQHQIND